MMPYQNQTYYQNSNPAYQQYMQQLQQQPNYQQNPYVQNPYAQSNQNLVGTNMSLPGGIVGKFYDNENEITANDVPMTGQQATFIKKDGSQIQLRCWNANGTISTTIYKPVIESMEQNSNENSNYNFVDDMKEFRNEINGRFDKIEKAIMGRTGRTKKEVPDEE